MLRENQDILRLLVVEDNQERIELFKSWFTADIIPVFAMSAGRAIRVLKRDVGRVDAGILLDHDFHEQSVSESDWSWSGRAIVQLMINHLSADIPVLVHSMNDGIDRRWSTRWRRLVSMSNVVLCPN